MVVIILILICINVILTSCSVCGDEEKNEDMVVENMVIVVNMVN